MKSVCAADAAVVSATHAQLLAGAELVGGRLDFWPAAAAAGSPASAVGVPASQTAWGAHMSDHAPDS